jgi:hypothetical protein
VAHAAGVVLLEGDAIAAAKYRKERLWLVPLERDLPQATMIGIARLKYPPQTAPTEAWRAEHEANGRDYYLAFAKIAGMVLEAIEAEAKAAKKRA